MTRKLFVLLLAIFVFNNQFFGQNPIAPSIGNGSEASPFQIENLNHLFWIAASSDRWDKSFIQVADIDASETATWPNGGWMSIGNEYFLFTGRYDGGGYSIENLYSQHPYMPYVGLFGKCNKVNFQNISLTNASFEAGSYVAILAGSVDSSTVSNCTVSGSVKGSSSVAGLFGEFRNSVVSNSHTELDNLHTSGSQSGGFIGYMYQSKVYTCSSKCSFIADTYNGGFIGYMSNSYVSGSSAQASIDSANNASAFIGYSYKDTIVNCFSTGAITNGDSYNGGLVGYMSYSVVDSCWTSVSIDSRSNSGGLVGSSYNSTISNSYASGDVRSKDNDRGSYFGGLIGYAGTLTIDNCYATGTIKGTSPYLGGLLGTAYEVSVANSYATGDVLVNGSSCFDVGGFSGSNDSGELNNCYSTGMVISNASYSSSAGGFVGFNDGKIANCYSTSHNFIYSDYSYNVGGFIGNAYQDSVVNCYTAGKVFSTSETGGFIGYGTESTIENIVWNGQLCPGMGGNSIATTVFDGQSASISEMQMKATYSEWDFSNRWSINEGKSFPWLVGVNNVAFAFPDTVTDILNYESAMTTDFIATVTANDIDPDNVGSILTARWCQIYNNSSYKALYQVGTVIGIDTVWGAYSFVQRNEPIQIKTYEQLCKIGTDASYPLNASYFLMNDINASPSITANAGKGFLPIGTDSLPFSGEFNGGTHIITNLFIARDTDNCGLFGTSRNANITDLQLKNCSVRGADNSGVIIGKMLGGTLKNSSATDGLCVAETSAGGLVGYATGAIKECSYSGSVTGTQYTGGLIGQLWGNVANCYVTGSVAGDQGVGGITGYHTKGTIVTSYSISSVIGATKKGALVGNGGNIELTGSLWDTELTGIDNCHGWDILEQNDLGKTTIEMKTVSTFTNNNWDFAGETLNGSDDIWVIYDGINDGYPIFVWQLHALSLRIKEGTSIIVISSDLTNTDITTVFSPVLESIVSIKNMSYMYSPAYPQYLNSLTDVQPGEAYIVRSEEPVYLYLPGSLSDATGTTVSLKKGWNLIGYPFVESNNVTDIFSGMIQKIEAIKNENGFYIPGNVLNGLDEMEFGTGYYVKVSEDCSFTW